jgi:uncharacterized protein (DUF1330 family)
MAEEEVKEVPVYGVWHDTIGGDKWDIDAYVPPCAAAIEKAGGSIVAWDMAISKIEGAPPKTAVAIVKFPSKAKFDEFYKDPGYQDALQMRLDNTDSGSWAALVREGLHKE